MAYPTGCPFCKKGNLIVFESTPTTAVLSCSDCNQLITVKTMTGKVLEVALPCLSLLCSLISVIAFFGITDITKIKAWLGLGNAQKQG